MKKELPSLLVIGMGAVCGGGVGVDALARDSKGLACKLSRIAKLERTLWGYRVDLAEERLRRWQERPRLRRASPIAVFLAEATQQALEQARQKEERLGSVGLVAVLGTGSIRYSRRFFSDVLEKGRKFASPALFPETVYNSPVSHVAAELGISGACYSIVGDETAWCEGLRVAQLWLALGKADSVVIAGAEELDEGAVEAYIRAGWVRRGLILGEGAGAICVKRHEGEAGTILRPLSRVKYGYVKANCMAEELEKSSSLGFYSAGAWRRKGHLSGETDQGGDWGAAYGAAASWATLQMIRTGLSGRVLLLGEVGIGNVLCDVVK